MIRNKCIQEILIEKDNLTSKEITNILIEKYPQIWDDKLAFYADAGKEKSESWVRNQLTAEVGSALRYWHKQGKIILGEVNDVRTFTATDSYKSQLKVGQFIDIDEIVVNEDEEINFDCENCNDKIGVVYFLKSEIFPDTYKIGKTTNLEKRIYDLSKDIRYGVFKLKEIGWVKIKNYDEVEKIFHSYFCKYRLYKNNLIVNVDTELFKTNHNFYDMWKQFIITNYMDNPIMKKEVLDFKF
jgi:hypothetical protein